MILDKILVDKLKQQNVVTLGLSMGKDSLACATILKNLKVKFIPFYFFHIPGLSFVEKQIQLYQNLLETEIIQMPHPMLYDNIRHQDFMTKEMAEEVYQYDFPKMTFADLMSTYLEENNIQAPYDIVGMRASESFNRRKFFEKYGCISESHKKIYPIYNWKKGDVIEYLNSNNIPLSDDYPIWDRSFDGLKYQFLFGVKENYPDDFEIIKQYFPLIEADLIRYEFNMEYFK